MARTQLTGTEINDGTVNIVDLHDDVLPYITQRSKPLDSILSGETVTVLEKRQHVVATEIIVEGEMLINGTLVVI